MILPKSRASIYGASLMLEEIIAHLLIVEGDRAISIIVRSFVGVILVSSTRPSTRRSCSAAWPSWTSTRPRRTRQTAWVSPAAPRGLPLLLLGWRTLEDGTLVGECLQK